MHMRASRSAAAAHARNDLTLIDHITDRHQIIPVMGIARDIAVSVTDFYHFTVAVMCARISHNTRRYRYDISTLTACEIDALMPGLATVERGQYAAQTPTTSSPCESDGRPP